jgi:starvation-inducible DNA-binding protein
MNKVELMNKYVADLSVMNVKFHNLHWNVTGRNFHGVHVFLEQLYDDLFEKFDEVAERIKMLGKFPKASVKAYLETSTVEELEDKDYDIKETFQITHAELNFLRDSAIAVRAAADEEGDFVTVAMMEDHVAGYDKNIWFIEQSLK